MVCSHDGNISSGLTPSMTASMPPRSSGVRVSPIRSDRDLEKALREIDALMDAARPGSEEEDRLEILSTLVDVLLSIHLWKVASSPTGFPQGVISAPVPGDRWKRPGPFAKVGLHSFVDLSLEGGRANAC